MAQGHDLAVRRARRDLEVVREALGLDHEGGVARGLEGARETREQPVAVVEDRRGLAVSWPLRADHATAQGGGQALVAEAHAEDRRRRAEPRDGFVRDAGLA